MRAIVWHARGDVRLDDVPHPDPPTQGQALVEVTRCGMCGSDRREYSSGPFLIPRTRHPLTGHLGPVTLGHEIVGRLVALGSVEDAPAGVVLGSRVAVNPTWWCGRCAACQRGEHEICAVAGCVGISSNGGLAEMVIVPARGLVPIPDHVTDNQAVLAEPLAVALHALIRGGFSRGDRVLVAGFGAIGAAVVAGARALGAGEIVVIEPLAERCHVAEGMGASRVIMPDAEHRLGIQDDLRDWADIALDCCGDVTTLRDAIEITRPGGRVVMVAIHHGQSPVAMNRLVLGERSMIGSVGYREEIAMAVALIGRGLVDADVFLEGVYGLAAATDWLSGASNTRHGLKLAIDPRC